MAEKFDFIIVGKGMMGAAAARHLSRSGARIALIGPDEPDDWPSHEGVFSSHYDNGRITRTIDPDPVWALLARRSIERYGEIERESGIGFYHEAGCLLTAPSPGGQGNYLENVMAARDRLGVTAPFVGEDGLKADFPWFRFPGKYSGVFEPRYAGHIDPRALVKAQATAAEKAGVTIVVAEVASVVQVGQSVDVAVLDGRVYSAARVLVAAGGFSIAASLLPHPLDLTVKARTVLFAEVGDDDLRRFAGMPSLIGEGPSQAESYYLLPPVLYPDGRHYIKIGGDPSDIALQNEADVRSWFRGSASRSAAEHLERLLRRVMPGFEPVSLKWSPCVTTFTRHGRPYIGFTGTEQIAVLTGGNGKAAKSSDEIGRLGALLLTTGRVDEESYGPVFEPCYRGR